MRAPLCSKLNFVKIAAVVSRDAGPKKTYFLLQEQQSRWDRVGEGCNSSPHIVEGIEAKPSLLKDVGLLLALTLLYNTV